MSKESRQLDYINKYFRKIGLQKIDDFDQAFKSFSSEEIKQISDRMEMLSKQREQGTCEQRALNTTILHDYTEQNYDMSIAACSFFDADIIFNCCLWIMNHKELLMTPAVDVGCGNGILTCFIAYNNPDIHIIGIDRSGNSINVANQIKEKLQLTNVEFQQADISDMDSEQFATVMSFRTVHENMDDKMTQIRFRPFDKQIEAYRELYCDYAKALCSLVKENGRLIQIERFNIDTDLFSYLLELNDNNLVFNSEIVEEITCKEADLPEPKVLTAFVADQRNTVPYNELFQLWAKLAFSSDENNPTNPQIDWNYYQSAGPLISGYVSYDNIGTQSVICAIHEKKFEPDYFVMYQANVAKKLLNVYPKTRLKEALDTFENGKKRDRENGFRIVELH